MSTHRVTRSRTIEAPVEVVWEVVDDTARYAEWVDGVLAVLRHHGRARVGETYAERNRTVGPLTAESTWTVREVVPHRRRVDAGTGLTPLRDLVNTFRFAPADGGRATEMTYEVEFALALGPFALGPLGRPLAAVLERTLGAEFERSMSNLDELVRSERDLPGR